MTHSRHGFTLIELLIVIGIIAILALIAIPNFLQAQVRAKVSRVQADMRSIASGLESYCVDWATYPPDGNGPPYAGLIAMTTPVAYLTQMVPDVFNLGFVDGRTGQHFGTNDPNTKRLFELGTGNPAGRDVAFPATVWALASYGPDQDDDTDLIGEYPFTQYSCPYDPTNGTVSNGDIYRVGGQMRPPNFDIGQVK
jgi:prepilin-type N-terminal cleavage/methylation domain-containing protein